MGRPKGSKNKPKFPQSGDLAAEPAKLTRAQLHHQQKRQVALMTHDGMSPEKIAAVMDIDLDKLKETYGRELQHGREIIRAAELMRLETASAEGKVAASKLLLAPPGAGDAASSSEADTGHDDLVKRALTLVCGGKSD